LGNAQHGLACGVRLERGVLKKKGEVGMRMRMRMRMRGKEGER
jgi:hypothetical protein